MNLFGISHCHFQVSLDGHRGSGDLLVIDPIVFLEAQEHCNDAPLRWGAPSSSIGEFKSQTNLTTETNMEQGALGDPS